MQAGNAAQAYSYYGAKPQTIAEHKLVAQYNSQAAVLGSSAAAQVCGVGVWVCWRGWGGGGWGCDWVDGPVL